MGVCNVEGLCGSPAHPSRNNHAHWELEAQQCPLDVVLEIQWLRYTVGQSPVFTTFPDSINGRLCGEPRSTKRTLKIDRKNISE